MKPATVFLGEMTNAEVEAFLRDHHSVIIPVGSTEQHGPHGPLLTDALVANEVARRVAPEVGAVVAPPINYGLAYPHAGFTGVALLRIPTFMAVIEDLCATFATIGFRRIVFLNGHYDNKFAIAYACANAAERMPAGVRAFTMHYWDGMTPEEWAEFPILHANKPEVSAVMAIDAGLVDTERLNAEWPPFPDGSSLEAMHTPLFYSSPGSVYRATRSGTWGDARESSVEFGQRCLEVAARATIRLLGDLELAFAAMPDR